MITATITFKSPVRNWEKDNKRGKLFSVNLLDDSGEIRCTIFDNHCDKFANIQVTYIQIILLYMHNIYKLYSLNANMKTQF